MKTTHETIEIRKMRLTDLKRVAEIEKEIFSVPWSEKGFADSLKQDCTLYLTVLQDDEIIGSFVMVQSLE